MKREWHPGDVALVNWSVAVRADDNLSWRTTSGRLSDCNVAHIRPQVRIDPEDPEQVERLAGHLADLNGERYGAELSDLVRAHLADDMQAALREFANPRPPKCKAALIVKGEHFACEHPEGHGMSHGNTAAGAIWGEGA